MTLFKKCQTFFHQTSRRFHSAMATLEPQKYVIARTVGTENILLVSGRLVKIKNPLMKNGPIKFEQFQSDPIFSSCFLLWTDD